jgi:hypothetical protein
VTWRDGVHLTATPIWCDARRRRDICFVSSAERVGRAGHGQLIATPLTLALLGASQGGHLGVPLRQRFTLGTLRLELIASGRGPGAAALHVDNAGHRVLYAGAIRPYTGPRPGAAERLAENRGIAGGGAMAIEPAEVRTCDALVVAAPFGATHHVFPPLGEVITHVLEWTHAQLANGRAPVLLVDGVLEGLEVAGVLAGLAVTLARPIRDAVKRAGASPPTEPDDARPRTRRATEATVFVWLASDRGGLARALGGRPHALARLSGHTLDGDSAGDTSFAWAGAADRAQLLAWIESTGAREVFVTGACATEIASSLGNRARVLGPPHQMTLFPGEVA